MIKPKRVDAGRIKIIESLFKDIEKMVSDKIIKKHKSVLNAKEDQIKKDSEEKTQQKYNGSFSDFFKDLTNNF